MAPITTTISDATTDPLPSTSSSRVNETSVSTNGDSSVAQQDHSSSQANTGHTKPGPSGDDQDNQGPKEDSVSKDENKKELNESTADHASKQGTSSLPVWANALPPQNTTEVHLSLEGRSL